MSSTIRVAEGRLPAMHVPCTWLPMQVAEALEAEAEDDGVAELVADDVTDELVAVDEDAVEEDWLEDGDELATDDGKAELSDV